VLVLVLTEDVTLAVVDAVELVDAKTLMVLFDVMEVMVAFTEVDVAETVVFESETVENAMVEFVEREVLFDEVLTVLLAEMPEEETLAVMLENVEVLLDKILDRLDAVVGPEVIVELVGMLEVVLLATLVGVGPAVVEFR
jgi:dolichyl-phosphate-mannose--protein O-mannosyl transferase